MIMAVAAFVFPDYDKSDPWDCFRGVYQDEGDAIKLLHGDRYDNKNLQLFDLCTHGWKSYKWQPLYEWNEREHTLTHRWNKNIAPILNVTYDEARDDYGDKEIVYRAGEWMRRTQP